MVSPAYSSREGKWHVIETATQQLSYYRKGEGLGPGGTERSR